jgi:tetratricopeptide (TPR) repeat protein
MANITAGPKLLPLSRTLTSNGCHFRSVERHLTRFWLVVCLVFVASPTRATSIAPEILQPEKETKRIEELDKANDSFTRGQYDQTLELLKQANKKHPILPPPRLMLARLFLIKGQLGLARSVLERGAAEYPDYPGAYTTFGNLALTEGRLTDASLHFEKAVSLAKAGQWTENQRRYFLVQSYGGLATVAEARENWPAAKAALSSWLEVEPMNGKAHQRLARALFNVNKYAEATEELKRAVKDDASLEPAAVTMGWFYTRKGDLGKAVEWMKYAVNSAPKDPRAHVGMASWLLQQGKPEDAKVYANAAAKLDSDSRDVKLLRGLIAQYLKDYAASERLFQAIYQESPEDFRASNQLVLALVEQPVDSKRSRALQLAEMNARLYPRSSEALGTLGWTYFRQRRLEEAERALRAAIAAGNSSADTAYYLARVIAERGQPEEAKQLLKSALSSRDNFMFRKEAQELLPQIRKKN